MKNQIRVFVAVNISKELRASISKLIRKLGGEMEGTKWVETENLHLTLKFLGDVPMNDLHRLIVALTRAAESMDAFDLELSGCGAFPDMRTPKTIWIGCAAGADEMTRLAEAIEKELFKLGYPKENRRFSPHLTIGRIKRGVPGQAETLMEFLETEKDNLFGSCAIDEIVLYSSELTRRGPVYDELAVIPLQS